MRTLSLSMILALTACHEPLKAEEANMVLPPDPVTGESEVVSDLLHFDQSVDVSESGTIFVGFEQTPDLANANQPLVWRCYGDGFDGGWEGEGCFTALPIYSASDDQFQGFGQQLAANGVYRLGCADPVATTALEDEQLWCDHIAEVDSGEEEQWLYHFEECGKPKVNLCVQMIDGVAHPNAQGNCGGLYVPPPICP